MINPWSLITQLTFPPRLFCKPGAIAALQGLQGSRVTLITGRSSLRSSGALERITQHLKTAGLSVQTGPPIAGEPTLDEVRQWSQTVSAQQPDWIVGVGGGSVLDAAKGIWIWVEHPSLKIEQVEKPHTLPALRTRSKLVLIPTTSGSGSECSSAVSFTEPGRGKRILVSQELLPDIAILDPELTQTMPPEVTAHTGMDAFTHAQEAYVSPLARPLVQTLAVAALQRLLAYLPRAYEKGDDLEAREQVQVAASFAGLAQNAASTGLTHALSHTFGPRLRKPHGLLNAAFLIPVIQFNLSEQTRGRYAALARDLGSDSIDALLERERQLLQSLNLKDSVIGRVREEASGTLEPDVARQVVQDVCARTNPRRVTAQELTSWLKSLKDTDERNSGTTA